MKHQSKLKILNTMTKTKIIYGGVSIVLVVGALIFTSKLISAKPEPRMDEGMQNTMYVQTDSVKYMDKQSDLFYRGRVTAYDNVSLSSEVQGMIMKGDVRFKEGEVFKKGDVLVRIYSKDVEATLKSDKSTFLQTLSSILPNLRVDYPEEYNKWLSFFNSLDVEKALPELPEINSNKEKVYLAANDVLSGYYTLRQQEITLSRYTIRAPFNGSFTAVNKEIGAIASAGVELATLVRIDKLEVTVPVFPDDLKWIKTGATVTLKDDEGNEQEATVSRISDFVDESNQLVNVFLTFNPNGKYDFLLGAYVDVTFVGGKVTGYQIPREAVVDGNYVYELKGKELEKTEIKILQSLEDSYIIAGVDPNTQVVTESLASVSSNVEYLAR